MDTLRGLLARERRNDRPALRAPGDPKRTYDYRRLLTDAWKTGNFLAHRGVRHGRTVGIVEVSPESILTVLGAASLGATARFDPPEAPELRALVAPTERVGEYDLPPGGQRVAHGTPPNDSTIAHFERAVWSENPTLAPVELSPTDPALVTDERSLTHADLLAGAESLVESDTIAADDVVALRAPLSEPGAVVAGVVAPLLAGATMLLPDERAVGDVAVVDADSAPEARVIDATAML